MVIYNRILVKRVAAKSPGSPVSPTPFRFPCSPSKVDCGAVSPESPFPEVTTLVLARAAANPALFIGFRLVFVPGRILARPGTIRPVHFGMAEYAGIAMGLAGGALAPWCILTFARVGP